MPAGPEELLNGHLLAQEGKCSSIPFSCSPENAEDGAQQRHAAGRRFHLQIYWRGLEVICFTLNNSKRTARETLL